MLYSDSGSPLLSIYIYIYMRYIYLWKPTLEAHIAEFPLDKMLTFEVLIGNSSIGWDTIS